MLFIVYIDPILTAFFPLDKHSFWLYSFIILCTVSFCHESVYT